MVAVDEDRPSARSFDLLAERVLTVAGIYGPNASGKSNVIESIDWLSRAVAQSLRAWDQSIPREPFKFGPGPQSPSTYLVEMVVEGVRYIYQLDVDDVQVLFEGLYNYPERRRRVLFEREGRDIRFRRGLGALSGTRELLTPSTLALSAAMRFDVPQVQRFARALGDIRIVGQHWPLGGRRPSIANMVGMSATMRLFDDKGTALRSTLFPDSEVAHSADREAALALLRFADLGIGEVEIVEDDREDSLTMSQARRNAPGRLRFIHRVLGQELPFSLEEESAGTQTWFSLIGPLLHILGEGGILLFDEIDASLHPHLSARLLELFQDPDTNPRGAQLIFTTHDTSLLNHLNRDEVWLTEKGEGGFTTLTALAEYGGDKVRRSMNLERAYLQGRFGAVPVLDQFTLRRVLGLASGDS